MKFYRCIQTLDLFAVLGDTAVLHRGTPLYGQPAWWGDEDADQSGRPEENRSDRKREKLETGILVVCSQYIYVQIQK